MSAETHGNAEILWLLVGSVVICLVWAWAHSRYLQGYAAGSRERDADYRTQCQGCRYRQRAIRQPLEVLQKDATTSESMERLDPFNWVYSEGVCIFDPYAKEGGHEDGNHRNGDS